MSDPSTNMWENRKISKIVDHEFARKAGGPKFVKYFIKWKNFACTTRETRQELMRLDPENWQAKMREYLEDLHGNLNRFEILIRKEPVLMELMVTYSQESE